MSDDTLDLPIPQHAIEVVIKMGAHDDEGFARELMMLAHEAERGELGNCASGGYSGSYSVTIGRRDITREAYNAELEAWSDQEKAKKAPTETTHDAD